jgi:hypothetical protein
MKLITRIATAAAVLALAAVPALATGPGTGQGNDDHPKPNASMPAKAKAYGRYCQNQSKRKAEGQDKSAFAQCVNAMAKATNAPATASDDAVAKAACKALSKKHTRGEKGTPFSRCVVAANRARQDKRREDRQQREAEDNAKFGATLSGANEVNDQGETNQGDQDAAGTAEIKFNSGRGTVCFTFSLTNFGELTGAHIHRGAAGSNGDIVVPLFSGAPADPAKPSGCVAADRALIKEIRANPAAFYVNVHTTEFPNGAARGQLAKVADDDGPTS